MVLDELAEIVTKYRNSSNILIGGDVNASIHRSKLNSRDNDSKVFNGTQFENPYYVSCAEYFLSF
jgi:hypothetical protein